MNHRSGFNRLGRNASHRRATLGALTLALFKYERVRTTLAKARETRRVAERLITRAREDSVHNRRIAGRAIQDERVLAKLFKDIAPRFAQRPGGYTRILKLGRRYGDSSEMAILELVERKERERLRKKKEAQAAKEG
ncbi:MAG: 50S ribosomal protein L17 [Spirochaetes bacterium]|nr:50S ribosomal protein L17 [Spirochaetota bacterium]